MVCFSAISSHIYHLCPVIQPFIAQIIHLRQYEDPFVSRLVIIDHISWVNIHLSVELVVTLSITYVATVDKKKER